MKPNGADYRKIKHNILKKLYSCGTFSKGHLLFERLLHGVPSHLEGYVKDVLMELVKERVVLLHGRTKHGDAYQLNIEKLKEIEKILFK